MFKGLKKQKKRGILKIGGAKKAPVLIPLKSLLPYEKREIVLALFSFL